MQLNPYLVFNGQCREAFELYGRTLGGKIEMMPFRDTVDNQLQSPCMIAA